MTDSLAVIVHEMRAWGGSNTPVCVVNWADRIAALEASPGVVDEVRRNDDGSLDEVVGRGDYHLEEMHDKHWSLRLGRHLIGLHSKSAIKVVFIENDLPAAPARPALVDSVIVASIANGYYGDRYGVDWVYRDDAAPRVSEQADPAPPVAGEVLERWGKAPAQSHLLLQQMADGYWTPWHIAARIVAEKDAETARLRVAHDAVDAAARRVRQRAEAAEQHAEALAGVLREWSDQNCGQIEWSPTLVARTRELLAERNGAR